MATTKPSYSEKSWLQEVVDADKDHYKRDEVYEFTNGRKMQSTDSTDKGVYDGN